MFRKLRENKALNNNFESITAKFVNSFELSNDVDHMLYADFIDQRDQSVMKLIRTLHSDDFASFVPNFYDLRLKEIYFRYRARNFPGSLTDEEQARWKDHCLRKLCEVNSENNSYLNLFESELEKLMLNHSGDNFKLSLLNKLDAYKADLLNKLQV